MSDTPCQTPRAELIQKALDHYDEISNKACHWVSLIPAAIKSYGELNDGETVSGLRADLAAANERAERGEGELAVAVQWALTIDALFNAGCAQGVDDSITGAAAACPYPADTPQRQWWQRGYKSAANLAQADLVKRQLAEVRSNWKKYEPIVGRMESAESQLATLRALLEKAEAERDRLKVALESEVVSLHKWHGHSSENVYQCQECADYEWTARMLKALRPADGAAKEGK